MLHKKVVVVLQLTPIRLGFLRVVFSGGWGKFECLILTSRGTNLRSF